MLKGIKKIFKKISMFLSKYDPEGNAVVGTALSIVYFFAGMVKFGQYQEHARNFLLITTGMLVFVTVGATVMTYKLNQAKMPKGGANHDYF
jgi:hypothetical protein